MNGRIQLDCGPAATIQSLGWMLVCDRNGVFVRRRSANADEIFPAMKGKEGVDLADAVGAEAAHDLRNAMARTSACARSVLAPRLRAGEALLDAVVHRTPHEFIIEFEPAGHDGATSPVDLASLILDRLSGLASPDKPQKLLAAAARLLSVGLHFDRAMIAPLDDRPEFHADYSLDNEPSRNAAIEGPALQGLMADYLDDFHPLRQSRTIHDAYGAANCILSEGSLSDAPLDLSRALLRGVSGAEKASLKQLSARACLLLPITVDGALWGLVACLNRGAVLPSLESRAIAELVVAFLSLHLRIALPPPPRPIRPGFLIAATSTKGGSRRARKKRCARDHDHIGPIVLD
jgi:light-regulated signal transduction histidine kinase (bacteriophytochrome)